MSELNDIQIGDWLMIVSTMKGSSYIIQQVTSTTSGLVRTLNHTFRRDGRSFSIKQKSLTARPATASEIEAWLSGRKKQETHKRTEPSEEVVLARYLASVSAEEWTRLGVAQLKRIKTALEKSRGGSDSFLNGSV
jgi:O-methyltransferase involved in polyketide biosynthesis